MAAASGPSGEAGAMSNHQPELRQEQRDGVQVAYGTVNMGDFYAGHTRKSYVKGDIAQ